jgi:uncharacterized protein with von Willebrand factor type A (vWA) domain
MKEGFYRSEFIPPEERNLHQLKGKTLKEVIEYLEGEEENPQESTSEKNWEEYQDREGQSIFDGFLELLRNKGVRVSTPEWLQFIQVIGKKTKANELKELVGTNELLNKVRLFAQTTLVKDKADEASFHEAFDEYFELAAKIYNKELQQEEDENKVEEKESRDNGVEPELKDQLGIKEVKENLSEDENHEDNEDVHGGKKDQHNDILKKEDLSKQGGGDKKEGPSGEGDKGQPSGMGKGFSGLKIKNQTGDSSEIPEAPQNTQQKKTEHGYLVGGGKGKSVFTERVQLDSIYEGEKLDKQAIQEREKRVGKVDRRLRYEERPDKASMREVIRNIRRIILDVSEVKGSNVDLKRTVGNFARRDFRFDYEREREKQPEIVLLIDVGGPVDEWSPLVKEVAEAMAEGLTKLEIYLFHNNLYGYVWKPNPKDLLASSYAKPNSLINVKSIIKRRKKVIVYGDAEMSYSEFEGDGWPPRGNDERVEKFGMGGEECLNFIKKKADSVVWISPVFQKEWENRDDSGTIHAVSEVIPMHDLTVGGVEDAIKDLMKK